MTEQPGDDPLRIALHALRSEYLADAPARVGELWSAFERVQNGDAGGAGTLRHLVHRLAGTGDSYGVPGVTGHARAAEQLIDRCATPPQRPSPADLDRLRSHLQGVADAFERARSTE